MGYVRKSKDTGFGKRGQDIRICGTERRTLHVGHRGRLEGCDMRYE